MDNRLKQINTWLQTDLNIGNYSIEPASADASFRRYFRLQLENDPNQSLIIMDAPPEKEDCGPFIDITNRLTNAGVNAPEVKAFSEENGFLLLSDLGNVMYLDKLNDENADNLYRAAIDTLITIQSQASTTSLPQYDEALLQQEMSLFSDWLLDKHLGLSTQGNWLADTFALLAQSALEQPQVFVHRDYHSRNLTWLADQAPGVLDFQDAVVGPISYDLVSILRDCYIKWPEERLVNWVTYYCDNVRQNETLPNFSDAEFTRWFDLMGIQRHLKASGIFARLYHRDDKKGYLKDIPRTLSYIEEVSRKYDELTELNMFLNQSLLPALKEIKT